MATLAATSPVASSWTRATDRCIAPWYGAYCGTADPGVVVEVGRGTLAGGHDDVLGRWRPHESGHGLWLDGVRARAHRREIRAGGVGDRPVDLSAGGIADDDHGALDRTRRTGRIR